MALDRTTAEPGPLSATELGGGRRTLDLAGIALCAIGAAILVAASFPLHKYAAEADAVLAGMQALDILHGARPVFFAGLRVGAFGSYVVALLFGVLGPTRTALALYPIALGVLTDCFLYLFWREILERRLALVALLFVVVPPPSYLFWTYMPNGYPPIFLFCALSLWLAARLVRRGPRDGLEAALFGLTAGLGWWQSLQTLICVGPAALWVLWQWRSGLDRGSRRRSIALAVAAFLLGAAPWILFNVAHPLASFRAYGARPASSLASVAGNVSYFADHSLPELVAPNAESLAGLLTDAGGRLLPWLRPLVLAVYAAAACFFAVRRRQISPWPLIVGVLLTTFVFNVFSEAGQLRGFTVRYVLPAGLVLPGVLALFSAWVARRSRALALLLVGCVLLFNVASYHWPGRPSRQAWEAGLKNDRQLLEHLDARGIRVVVGGYWETYPLNFSSAGRIFAIPCDHDYFDYASRLPAESLEWALLHSRASQLAGWAERAGVHGATETLPPQYVLFGLVEGRPPAETNGAFLRHLLSTCPSP